MSDEIERLLGQVTPPGAPSELRARVLVAVAAELRLGPKVQSRPGFRPGLTAAASLLAAVALHYWVNDSVNHRLARALGPLPVRRQAAEIAADVASITEPSIGQWVYERLTRRGPRGGDPRRYAARLEQMIQQLTVDSKETAYEARDENPQMDRNRRSSRDYRPAANQCVFRMEYRNTA